MSASPPGAAPFTERTPRVVAARRLTRRAGRSEAGRFLAEGAQAVREALAIAKAGANSGTDSGAGTGWPMVHELFVTDGARQRYPDLVWAARDAGVEVSPVTIRAATALSETVTPQGILAVCDLLDRPLDTVLVGTPRLVAVLVGVADPGNAGTALRIADAAGADALLFAGDTVDPHNGKCVRASAGSVFHVPFARVRRVSDALDACRAAGLSLVAADSHARDDLDTALDQGALLEPTAWLFGNEAHGLPEDVREAADAALRVPIHGRAESLNLAAAAAICLYASARAQRQAGTRATPEGSIA